MDRLKVLKTVPKFRKQSSSAYAHQITTRSKDMLVNLPTEIVDQILRHLDKEDWFTTRRTHRLFQASSRLLIFQNVELYNFRPGVQPCNVRQLLHLLQTDVQLRNYVQTVRVRSVLDPTVHDEVERLLPQVLGLVKLQKLVLAFPELEYVTNGTQENCVNMLQRT